jgi:hypothetical protein
MLLALEVEEAKGDWKVRGPPKSIIEHHMIALPGSRDMLFVVTFKRFTSTAAWDLRVTVNQNRHRCLSRHDRVPLTSCQLMQRVDLPLFPLHAPDGHRQPSPDLGGSPEEIVSLVEELLLEKGPMLAEYLAIEVGVAMIASALQDTSCDGNRERDGDRGCDIVMGRGRGRGRGHGIVMGRALKVASVCFAVERSRAPHSVNYWYEPCKQPDASMRAMHA